MEIPFDLVSLVSLVSLVAWRRPRVPDDSDSVPARFTGFSMASTNFGLVNYCKQVNLLMTNADVIQVHLPLLSSIRLKP